jgi:hypothetical protein
VLDTISNIGVIRSEIDMLCFQMPKELPWFLQFQVNNGEVDFDRSQANTESFCYTAVNPFHVRLLSHKKEQEGRQFQLSKKRVKSPIRKGGPKLGKNGNTRCTPEGKKRRRSRVVEPVDLHSAGWPRHHKQVLLLELFNPCADWLGALTMWLLHYL